MTWVGVVAWVTLANVLWAGVVYLHERLDLRVRTTVPGSLRRLKLCAVSRATWWLDTGLLASFLTAQVRFVVTGTGHWYTGVTAGLNALALVVNLRHWRTCPGGENYPGGLARRVLGRLRGAARGVAEVGG